MRRWRRVDWLYVDLPAAHPGSLNAYLIAALVPALAAAARLGLDQWIAGVQFVTFYPAVILVALLCGLGAGLFSVFASAMLAWYLIVPPRRSFDIDGLDNWVTLGLFVATAAVMVLLVSAMRLAIGRYRVLSASLRRRVEQSTEELQSTQASLVQAQKMEAVGQLTGGIAHDFNNMLAIVIGNLDIARRRLAEGRADVSRQIESAAEGADRAAALTRRLLVFARRQPLEPAVVDINRLLNDLSELLRRALGEMTRIESELAERPWPISVDPAQMESAIINLAINARDAMGGAGTLTIQTANIGVPEDQAQPESGLAAGDYVLVSVVDTGSGMSPEVAARAVEPFFTTKEVGRGTGLGLSQVYGFVRQSGGHVEIESQEGAGTTVRLYLPRHSGSEAPAPSGGKDAAPPRGSPGEVVLVVEDEDQVRGTTVDALVELGYGVREARDGVEALAILASDPSVSLLFTDIVMPGLDGRQLAERALRQRPDLKILYTTGYAPEGGIELSLPDDYPALLQKPFGFEQMARKVRQMLDD
ncbi:ATP-binding protein [Allosphingosinicella sp.]|jgi:signal transduction histidine kinase/CheY-like chemotaxis protein|uniref:ATP-binding protein n=1 Tax=Allosphingosinicella sp. TaxID=2823234 RepID=UPI002F0FFA5D